MSWESSDRRGRLPSDWSSRIVPTVLRLYRGRCHVCSRQGATEVDHVIPGDDHRLSNLRPIHQDCHREKTQREAVAARARIRALKRRPAEPHPLDQPPAPERHAPDAPPPTPRVHHHRR